MLVLTRKKEEAIVINGNVTVKVLQVMGNTVRLGIAAPESVKILRRELCPRDADNLAGVPEPGPMQVRERGRGLADYLRPSCTEVPTLLTVTV